MRQFWPCLYCEEPVERNLRYHLKCKKIVQKIRAERRARVEGLPFYLKPERKDYTIFRDTGNANARKRRNGALKRKTDAGAGNYLSFL